MAEFSYFSQRALGHEHVSCGTWLVRWFSLATMPRFSLMVISKSCRTGASAGLAPPAHFRRCSMLASRDASFSWGHQQQRENRIWMGLSYHYSKNQIRIQNVILIGVCELGPFIIICNYICCICWKITILKTGNNPLPLNLWSSVSIMWFYFCILFEEHDYQSPKHTKGLRLFSNNA